MVGSVGWRVLQVGLAAFAALSAVIQFYNDEKLIVALVSACVFAVMMAVEVVQLRHRLDETQVQLEIVYERRFPMWWHSERWVRVGIRNKSKRTVAENVEVQLLSIAPEPNDTLWLNVLPCRLGRKDADEKTRATETIRINPTHAVYFDLVQGIRPMIQIWTVVPVRRDGWQAAEIELDTEYRLTVGVSAGNAAGAQPSRTFGLRWPADRDPYSLEFYPLDQTSERQADRVPADLGEPAPLTP
jgi:hypothetical protein